MEQGEFLAEENELRGTTGPMLGGAGAGAEVLVEEAGRQATDPVTYIGGASGPAVKTAGKVASRVKRTGVWQRLKRWIFGDKPSTSQSNSLHKSTASNAAEGNLDEVVESGPWKKPDNFQRPAADKGDFVGDEGNSMFQLSDKGADSIGVPQGTQIPWVRGVPDFGEFGVAGPKGPRGSVSSTFEVLGMTGDHNADKTLMLNAMKETTGFSRRYIEGWLKQNKAVLHHAGGDNVQIVPTKIHRLHHSGGALEKRVENGLSN